MEYSIDAENQILGRLASNVAMLLRGKDAPSFDPARMPTNVVTVYNTDKIRVTGRKLLQKQYRSHSGYHGGLRERTLKVVLADDSRVAFRHAVMGMLPKNRLRAKIIKNLILIKEKK